MHPTATGVSTRIKLMVVGQENVGKTSLVKALKKLKSTKKKDHVALTRSGSFSSGSLTPLAKIKRKDPNEQHSGDTLSTDGIIIEEVNFDNIQFSVWDFGGQDVYYTTHSFFLSERSLYLVVWNVEDSNPSAQSKIEYWLNTIVAHAPKSPILLVATHLDSKKTTNKQDIQDILDNTLKKSKQFRQVKGCVGVSTTSGHGMTELKSLVVEIASKEPYMNKLIETKFIVLDQYIVTVERERLKRVPLISWQEFVEKAQSVNIGKNGSPEEREAELEEAAEFLHTLGTILYFNNGKESIIVVDPEWIISLFRTLFTTKHSFIKDGFIPFSVLSNHIWKDDLPKEMHTTLLGVFEHFEVMFKVTPDVRDCLNLMANDANVFKNDEELLLVPSLLPVAKPADSFGLWFSEPHLYSRQYIFEFIPHGLFNRLLFRLINHAPPFRFWRFGVLLHKNKQAQSNSKNGNIYALVELKGDFNMITIDVRGEDSTESLNLFCHIVELIEFLFNHAYSSLNTETIYIDTDSQCRFSREQIEKNSLQGIWFLEQGSTTLRMDKIAPDIALSRLGTLEIKDFQGQVSVGALIGEGAFAQVYKGTFNGQAVAIKKLNMRKITTEDQARTIFNEFRKEVTTMSLVHHPNIVDIVGFSVSAPFSLVLEYVPQGSLHEFVLQHAKQSSWHLKLKIGLDVANAMHCLHSFDPPLIHRDLKSPNILMVSLNPSDPVVAKISDFGISGKLYTSAFKATKAKHRQVGNPTWLAPEILREEPSGAPADVYPYGIILWELVTGEHPFGEYNFAFNMDLEEAICKGVRPTIPATCPHEFASLIQTCWHDIPEERLTFKQILKERLPTITRSLAPDLHNAAVQEAKNSSATPSKTKATNSNSPNTSNRTSSFSKTPRPSSESEMFNFTSVMERIKQWHQLNGTPLQQDATPKPAGGSPQQQEKLASSRRMSKPPAFKPPPAPNFSPVPPPVPPPLPSAPAPPSTNVPPPLPTTNAPASTSLPTQNPPVITPPAPRPLPTIPARPRPLSFSLSSPPPLPSKTNRPNLNETQ